MLDEQELAELEAWSALVEAYRAVAGLTPAELSDPARRRVHDVRRHVACLCLEVEFALVRPSKVVADVLNLCECLVPLLNREAGPTCREYIQHVGATPPIRTALVEWKGLHSPDVPSDPETVRRIGQRMGRSVEVQVEQIRTCAEVLCPSLLDRLAVLAHAAEVLAGPERQPGH
jgi:hypothetical protein